MWKKAYYQGAPCIDMHAKSTGYGDAGYGICVKMAHEHPAPCMEGCLSQLHLPHIFLGKDDVVPG
jgi:hypothetical protein